VNRVGRGSVVFKAPRYKPERRGFETRRGEWIFFNLTKLPASIGHARSKARTVFARSNTEIVGSNPTRGMDVCVLCLARVEAGKNTSAVIPASRKRRQNGDPVVSGETVPADLREG
jgi:hypothetical protein